MPGHRHYPGMDSETLTGLLIYLRRLGSNAASTPELATVTQLMNAPARAAPWTVKELVNIPYVTPFDKFTGEYKISFIKFTFRVEQGQLTVSAPMYGSSPLEQVDANSFKVEQGGESLHFRFEEDAQGNVTELYLLRGGEEHRIQKVL